MPYTAFDRFVAWRRFRAALPHLRPKARVCDIGCGLDARFLKYVRDRIGFGVGIDTQVTTSVSPTRELIRWDFTRGLPLSSSSFDHAILLAVLEHIEQPRTLFTEVFRILAPGGSLIMTWPSGSIDPFLHALHCAGLVSSEMESEQHQARIPLPKLLLMLTEAGFSGCRRRRFEFGLNNLLVGYKATAKPEAAPLERKQQGRTEQYTAL